MSNRLGRGLIIIICLVTILYSIPFSGVNQAFALQSLKASQMQQSMPQSPGNLTVYGQWRYYQNGDFTPAKYYLVGIYTATNPEQLLAWGYTDGVGQFAIGPFANPNTAIRHRLSSF